MTVCTGAYRASRLPKPLRVRRCDATEPLRTRAKIHIQTFWDASISENPEPEHIHLCLVTRARLSIVFFRNVKTG